MIREEVVNSAVTFLRDPSVASSPLDKRIAFLRSKNLTQEEINTALARAGESPASGSAANAQTPFAATHGYQNPQVLRPEQGGYGVYQPGYWQQQPPLLPRRDWRDWFIMATMMGGVTYGLYVVAKRYIYPLIAPPTPPRLEQDRKAIEESFNKAFALLDQLNTDTEALKASEQARTERLDSALKEVETTIHELKTASRRREDQSTRISDEVRGLKDLIPRVMELHKENADTKLKELNQELKSLKTLVSNRIGVGQKTTLGAGGSSGTTNGEMRPNSASPLPDHASAGAPDGSSGQGNEHQVSSSTFSNIEQRSGAGATTSGLPTNRAAIPAWQMATANKAPFGSGNG